MIRMWYLMFIEYNKGLFGVESLGRRNYLNFKKPQALTVDRFNCHTCEWFAKNLLPSFDVEYQQF